ncbi:MAG: phage scaffolding protein [Clostridia bacterium]|jgi:hypothetical protein|nr:phage scaffolding protein [Clostridia bacterium]MCI2014057.1 phage scaffolding protein [Clostridia bacterium]
MKLDWLKAIIGDSYTDEMDSKAAAKLGESYVSKADYDTLNTAKADLDKQIKARDKDIEALKKSSGSNEDLQKQFNDLQEKYKTEKTGYDKKISDMAKNNAVDMAILQAKGKNSKAIKALLDMDKINLKDDGSIDGLDLEGLKKSDSYLFDVEEIKNVSNGFHPGDNKDNGGGTSIDAFVSSARAAAGLKD